MKKLFIHFNHMRTNDMASIHYSCREIATSKRKMKMWTKSKKMPNVPINVILLTMTMIVRMMSLHRMIVKNGQTNDAEFV